MTASDPAPAASSLATVRGLVGHATQQLLGATIEVSDEHWRGPSRCPGWTRGHVATHLARNAEAIARLASWASSGERRDPYPSPEHRSADIDAGAERPGLELQVDLDTTAGGLDEAFDAVEEQSAWDATIEVRGTGQPARILPLMRLSELVLHHLDLDIGLEVGDLDAETVDWLLEFAASRLRGRAGFPGLDLRSDSGYHATVGEDGAEPALVSGPGALLLGWLTGRSGTDGLTGAEGITLPAFA